MLIKEGEGVEEFVYLVGVVKKLARKYLVLNINVVFSCNKIVLSFLKKISGKVKNQILE